MSSNTIERPIDSFFTSIPLLDSIATSIEARPKPWGSLSETRPKRSAKQTLRNSTVTPKSATRDKTKLSKHILRKGSISSLARSGMCQGGLSKQEVMRKLEIQRQNDNLMTSLAHVSSRKNQYHGPNPGMMSKQTRPQREKK